MLAEIKQAIIESTWQTKLGFILLIIISVGLISYFITVSNKTATPSNISRILMSQKADLESRYLGVSLKRTGLSEAWNRISADQQLLININMLSTRLTGYMGPFMDGVFSVDDAVRIAMTAGSRCMILEIDTLDDVEPVLTFRDTNNYVRALNKGSIREAASSIAGRAFNPNSDSVPPRLVNSPFILVLYFRKVPDMYKSAREYLTFLGKVAQQLQPLNTALLGATPQGEFRRQGNESQLFFMPTEILQNKVIVLCNVDTSMFRRKSEFGLSSLPADNDLDILVHCRLYSRESPSGLGATTGPRSTTEPAAVITTPGYWINTPPDRIPEAVESTKRAFTIVMTPDAEKEISKETLDKLLTQYGVNAVPFVLFEDAKKTDAWIGKSGHYENAGIRAKGDRLRFIPPKPILVLKQNPATNSGGGAIVAPSL